LGSEPEKIGTGTGAASRDADIRGGLHRLRRYRRRGLVLIASAVMLGAFAVSAAISHTAAYHSTAFAQSPPAWAGSVSVFTTARPSLIDAFKEYLGWQSAPVQPIAFNHKIHVQNNIDCTSCHQGVTQGPDAGIPSVGFCMACHQAIAVDKPEIKKLAAYADKGQDVPWQHVYWFYPETHVRFRHSPHINAGVNCNECHGDLAQQTVAVRSRNLTMNFCLSCHRAKGASVDCTTCHY
jgi:Cytochrome c7 and related cytochrome c